jgi:hypothetical protein
LVSPDAADRVLALLKRTAEGLGWELEVSRGPGVARVDLAVRSGLATPAPDGWTLLQAARAQHGVGALQGVALDHLLSVHPGAEANPFHMSHPFTCRTPSTCHTEPAVL